MVKMQKLTFAVIVTDKKTTRYIVAKTSTIKYPLVFERQWIEDDFLEGDYYSLYVDALTLEQADEIITLVSNNKSRNAATIIKKALHESESIIDEAGPVMLDDYIPDDWYDCWKDMEYIITADRHLPGVYNHDVKGRL